MTTVVFSLIRKPGDTRALPALLFITPANVMGTCFSDFPA
jgi:hypothetical protein